MSYTDGGNTPNNNYQPPLPTPPKAGRSPFVYVAAGCGLLTLITMGGCIMLAVNVKNKMVQEQNKPLSVATVEQDLKDIPKPKGAVVDIKQSKVYRATFKAGEAVGFGKVKTTAGVYTVKGEPEDIVAWYDKVMISKEGWEVAPGKTSFQNQKTGVRTQRQYIKGKNQLMVMVGPATEEKKSSLILTKIDVTE